jgi:hypothetical protein
MDSPVPANSRPSCRREHRREKTELLNFQPLIGPRSDLSDGTLPVAAPIEIRGRQYASN